MGTKPPLTSVKYLYGLEEEEEMVSPSKSPAEEEFSNKKLLPEAKDAVAVMVGDKIVDWKIVDEVRGAKMGALKALTTAQKPARKRVSNGDVLLKRQRSSNKKSTPQQKAQKVKLKAPVASKAKTKPILKGVKKETRKDSKEIVVKNNKEATVKNSREVMIKADPLSLPSAVMLADDFIDINAFQSVEVALSSLPLEMPPAPVFDFLESNILLCDEASSRESKTIRCMCTPTMEQLRAGRGCGEDCLNRQLFMECGSRCPSGKFCTNKQFQKQQYADLEIFPAGLKGWGLRARSSIAKGHFIIEYVGEVVDGFEKARRIKRYGKDPRHKHHYFMALRNDAVIDATARGNLSRFINHSCDPNAVTQKWSVNRQLRVGFFALRPIKAGEEIVFNYQFERYGKKAQPCYCGASNCTGFIGGRNNEEVLDDDIEFSSACSSESSDSDYEQQDESLKSSVVKATDAKKHSIASMKTTKPSFQSTTTVDTEEVKTVVEKIVVRKKKKHREHRHRPSTEQLAKRLEIEKEKTKLLELEEVSEMLNRGPLRNKEHVMEFNRLMVRVDQAESRKKMIEFLLQTADQDILRLFVQNQGLGLLRIWFVMPEMAESKTLKMRNNIVRLLLRLPIENQQQIDEAAILPNLKHARKNALSNEAVVEDVLMDAVYKISARDTPSHLNNRPDSLIVEHANLQLNLQKVLDKWAQLSFFKIPKKGEVDLSDSITDMIIDSDDEPSTVSSAVSSHYHQYVIASRGQIPNSRFHNYSSTNNDQMKFRGFTHLANQAFRSSLERDRRERDRKDKKHIVNMEREVERTKKSNNRVVQNAPQAVFHSPLERARRERNKKHALSFQREEHKREERNIKCVMNMGRGKLYKEEKEENHFVHIGVTDLTSAAKVPTEHVSRFSSRNLKHAGISASPLTAAGAMNIPPPGLIFPLPPPSLVIPPQAQMVTSFPPPPPSVVLFPPPMPTAHHILIHNLPPVATSSANMSQPPPPPPPPPPFTFSLNNHPAASSSNGSMNTTNKLTLDEIDLPKTKKANHSKSRKTKSRHFSVVEIKTADVTLADIELPESPKAKSNVLLNVQSSVPSLQQSRESLKAEPNPLLKTIDTESNLVVKLEPTNEVNFPLIDKPSNLVGEPPNPPQLKPDYLASSANIAKYIESLNEHMNSIKTYIESLLDYSTKTYENALCDDSSENSTKNEQSNKEISIALKRKRTKSTLCINSLPISSTNEDNDSKLKISQVSEGTSMNDMSENSTNTVETTNSTEKSIPEAKKRRIGETTTPPEDPLISKDKDKKAVAVTPSNTTAKPAVKKVVSKSGNWMAAKDSDGSVYYFHIVTREAVWELPLDEQVPDDDGTNDMTEDSATVTSNGDASCSSVVKRDERRVEFKRQVSDFVSKQMQPYRNRFFADTNEFIQFLRKVTHKVVDNQDKGNCQELNFTESVRSSTKRLVEEYIRMFKISRGNGVGGYAAPAVSSNHNHRLSHHHHASSSSSKRRLSSSIVVKTENSESPSIVSSVSEDKNQQSV